MNATSASERHKESETARTASSGKDAAADALRAASDLASDVGRLGTAWFKLARAEMTMARVSAFRLVLGVFSALVLGFGVWLFANLALVYWLNTLFLRMDLASVAVAALNVVGLAVLIACMRRWWRAMHMTRSRAALGEIARTLS